MISFKQFKSNEECRSAFMGMVSAKDKWEAQMRSLLSQRQMTGV